MGNCFRVIVPNDFPQSERDKLFSKINNWSSLVFSKYRTPQQIDFLMNSKDASVDSIRRDFGIPDSCEVIDTSGFDYSP